MKHLAWDFTIGVLFLGLAACESNGSGQVTGGDAVDSAGIAPDTGGGTPDITADATDTGGTVGDAADTAGTTGDATDGQGEVELPANPDHTEDHMGVMHHPGGANPLVNCVSCHGATLKGGIGPSCYTCHNTDDHTLIRHGIPHRPGTMSSCNTCHGPNNSGGMGPACSKCHH